MKTLLVATDLSPRSDRAVRRAFALAEAHGCRLYVVNVVDNALPMELADELREKTEKNVRAFCSTVSDHPFEVRVVVGDPILRVNALAEELEADLIVLGIHRRRPFLDLVTSTTMERLVKSGAKPVLLAAETGEAPYARVLAGVDLSPASAAVIRLAAIVAPEAEIHGFHGVHIPYRKLSAPHGTAAQLKPFLDDAARDLEAWRAKEDLPERFLEPVPMPLGRSGALDAAMEAVKPDLLAIGAHGRATFSPTLLGSFTEELLRDPPCDLLVARR